MCSLEGNCIYKVDTEVIEGEIIDAEFSEYEWYLRFESGSNYVNENLLPSQGVKQWAITGIINKIDKNYLVGIHKWSASILYSI